MAKLNLGTVFFSKAQATFWIQTILHVQHILCNKTMVFQHNANHLTVDCSNWNTVPLNYSWTMKMYKYLSISHVRDMIYMMQQLWRTKRYMDNKYQPSIMLLYQTASSVKIQKLSDLHKVNINLVILHKEINTNKTYNSSTRCSQCIISFSTMFCSII